MALGSRLPEFGDYVVELAEGRSTRELSRATEISHSTISEMLSGFPPKYRVLEQFADKLGLDDRQRHELFRRARYTMHQGSPAQRLIDWLADYNRRYDRGAEIRLSGGMDALSHEDVDRLIAFHEERAVRLGWPLVGNEEPSERWRGDPETE